MTSSSSGPTPFIAHLEAAGSAVAEAGVAEAAAVAEAAVAESVVAEAAAVAEAAIAEAAAAVAEGAVHKGQGLDALGQGRQVGGEAVGALVGVGGRGGRGFLAVGKDGLAKDDGAGGREGGGETLQQLTTGQSIHGA